jgi:hypothetical protein
MSQASDANDFVSKAEHKMRVRDVPVDRIKPNPWNPNEMDDETFNRLAEEIQSVGFIDPIQVVPTEDDMFMIIGGEHRWRVSKVLGYEFVPCVVLDDAKWSDVDLQKFVTTRLNALHGKVNPEKFMQLYLDLAKRHEEGALQALMGFTDQDAWKSLTKGVRKGLEDAGVNKEALKKFDEAAAELKTVDDLSGILNKLFTDHGNDLKYNFMILSFGGKEHLYVQFDSKSDFGRVKKKIESMRGSGTTADRVLHDLLDGWAGPAVTKDETAPTGA